MVSVSAVTKGLATLLDAEEIGTYRVASAYGPDETAITIKRLPAAPATAIAIAAYDVEDATVVPGDRVRVQLRFRAPGERTAVDDLADSVLPLLHWRHHYDLGDIRVQRSERLIVADLGPDENGREQRADSYEFLIA